MNARRSTLAILIILLLAMSWPAAAEEAPIRSADLVLAGPDFAPGHFEETAAGEEGLTLAGEALSGRYLSNIMEAPLPFNAVVPRWLAETPVEAGMAIQLRTGTRTGQWSPWYLIVENEDWSLPTDPDTVGQMITVPAADITHTLIQVAVSFSRYEAQPAAVLEQLVLTFIDSSAGPTAEELLARQQALDAAQAARQPAAPEGYPKPTVISRAVWCTDPRCNYSNGLEYYPVSHLIVHHTVSSNSSSNWAAVVRAIWLYHYQTRGWGDIGYNYLVDMNGYLYEGHAGGDNVVGIHASGANAGSMALAFLGTFTAPDYPNLPGIRPPAAMLNSAANLFAWKADKEEIDVFDAGYLPNVAWGLPNLMGHRDVYGLTNTECPGDQAHNLLPWLRSEVASRIGFVSPYQYVDELSTAFTKSSSNWYTAVKGGGFNGHAYYTWSTTNPAQSTNWGEWRPPVSKAGAYEIQSYAPYVNTGAAETTDARYQVTDACGTRTVSVNQDAHVGAWMTVGTFHLTAGSSGRVRLTDLAPNDPSGGGRGVWFDAIRLRPLNVDMRVWNQAPGHNSWLANRSVTFRWTTENVPCSKQVTLQVATDGEFKNLVLSKSLSAGTTSYSHTFGQDYVGLRWRIVLTTPTDQTVVSPVTVFGIDTQPPTSLVDLVLVDEQGHYYVGWSGLDAGSGVAAYNLDYRAQGTSNWIRLLSNSNRQGQRFVPPDGRVYEFRSQAVDRLGHWESPHSQADANTAGAILVRPILRFAEVRR